MSASRETRPRTGASDIAPRPPGPPAAVTLVAHHIGPVGGMERQLVELVMGLRRRGHNVTVIAHECELPPGAGVAFHRVRGPSRPFLLGYPWFMLFGSLAVRRFGRGVIQATGAIILNRVDVISVHYCHQVGNITPSRNDRLFRAHVKAMGLMSRVAERACFRANASARFVCVSDGVAAEIREHYPQLAERVVVVHNGVDIDAFAPGSRAAEADALCERLGLPENRLLAVFVGSEWKRKGLEHAIGALALADEWDLLVVGSGDRDHYDLIARQLGVSRRIHWHGVSSDVAPLYQMADAFVFPSSYEAFPLVVLEAAASGLPILSTPLNGVRELIEDGQNGLLISQDPEVIAERMRLLGADPQLREKLGAAVRESVLAFSWEAMVTGHEALYSSLGDQLAR